MFALFFSLYYSMFTGSWQLYTWSDLNNATFMNNFSPWVKLITSIFGDNLYENFGADISTARTLQVVAFILALITSIGIVVMAVKGVKKAFGIFFGHIR